MEQKGRNVGDLGLTFHNLAEYASCCHYCLVGLSCGRDNKLFYVLARGIESMFDGRFDMTLWGMSDKSVIFKD